MYTEFIKVSTDCVVACEQCIQACLMEGEALSCCRYCIDCSALGALAEKMASAKSPFTDDILMLFAKACDACARECEKHAMNHHHCKVCAEACRASSRVGREMMLQMRD